MSVTKKYDRALTHPLHSQPHWLDVEDRVTYKLGVSQIIQAPDYLSELCTPVAQIAERQHPTRCSTVSELVEMCAVLGVRQGHCKCHHVTERIRPSHLRCRWTNDMEVSFQDNLRQQDMQIDCFCGTLKTFLFE